MPRDTNAEFQDLRNVLYHLTNEELKGYFGKYQEEAKRLRKILERQRTPKPAPMSENVPR
jgi:hypothetical protein